MNTLIELKFLITKGNAHRSFEEVVEGMPPGKRGAAPEGLPYSVWQLVEHIRITQWDILEFSRDPEHRSPEWPDGYWPEPRRDVSDEAWERSITDMLADRHSFLDLLHTRRHELHTAFPHGEGQTLLREALLIADHTSYHVGQIVVVRRLLNCW